MSIECSTLRLKPQRFVRNGIIFFWISSKRDSANSTDGSSILFTSKGTWERGGYLPQGRSVRLPQGGLARFRPPMAWSRNAPKRRKNLWRRAARVFKVTTRGTPVVPVMGKAVEKGGTTVLAKALSQEGGNHGASKSAAPARLPYEEQDPQPPFAVAPRIRSWREYRGKRSSGGPCLLARLACTSPKFFWADRQICIFFSHLQIGVLPLISMFWFHFDMVPPAVHTFL